MSATYTFLRPTEEHDLLAAPMPMQDCFVVRAVSPAGRYELRGAAPGSMDTRGWFNIDRQQFDDLIERCADEHDPLVVAWQDEVVDRDPNDGPPTEHCIGCGIGRTDEALIENGWLYGPVCQDCAQDAIESIECSTPIRRPVAS